MCCRLSSGGEPGVSPPSHPARACGAPTARCGPRTATRRRISQLLLTLLDRDRLEGKYQAKVYSADTSGVMRRMVKEYLLTFEGKPLFAERIAETVPYELTALEQDLYEQVAPQAARPVPRGGARAQGRGGR
jgi:hypothetical protein